MFNEHIRITRIVTQPIILKWRRLQISHDHPFNGKHIKHDGSEVINVYWNYRHILSKVPSGLTLPPYSVRFTRSCLYIHNHSTGKNGRIITSPRLIFRKLKRWVMSIYA